QHTQQRTGTFLIWPKFRAESIAPGSEFKAYYALADSSKKGSSSWFLGRVSGSATHLDWSVKLQCEDLAQPLYSIHGQEVIGGVPELMAIVDGEDRALGYGLFEIGLTSIPNCTDETWGVDFGSSSSVVAIRSGAEVVTLKLHGRLDQ